MKKLFTFFWGLLTVIGLQAQSEFPVQFADKDGNTFDDGSTLVLTEYEADAFGSIEMPTNLYVKNMTTESVQIGGIYTIETLDNGLFQTCFPENCVAQERTGTFETKSGTLGADELKNMQTEWMPMDNGKCVVTYQLVTYKQNTLTKEWSIDQHGPTITLDFTLIMNDIRTAGTKVVSITYYDLTGQKTNRPKHGVYLQKIVYQDGSSKTLKKLFR
jgi:hypothetical protein